MQVIVAGATGFIGKAVVAECISNEAISSIIVLSRRGIDTTLTESPKVKLILHQDFLNYTRNLLDQLQGSQGCIWCLGGKVEDFLTLKTAREVGVDFALAAANAFLKDICPNLQPKGQRFHFIFCSGNGAEWDQDKKLWIFNDTRKLKGTAERGLLDIAEANAELFEAIMLRPGGVTPDTSVLLTMIAGLITPVVPVSQLAKALVVACLNPPNEKVLENAGIVKLAINA